MKQFLHTIFLIFFIFIFNFNFNFDFILDFILGFNFDFILGFNLDFNLDLTRFPNFIHLHCLVLDPDYFNKFYFYSYIKDKTYILFYKYFY